MADQTESAHAEFDFWYAIQVRYRDVDRQDIVYFGAYLDFFAIGIHEYFRSLGVLLRETEPSGEFDSVFAHVEIDYTGSARLDDVVEVGVRPVRLGTSSVTFGAAVRRADDQAPLCHGSLVMVNIDRASGRSKPIPPRVREAVAGHEAAPA